MEKHHRRKIRPRNSYNEWGFREGKERGEGKKDVGGKTRLKGLVSRNIVRKRLPGCQKGGIELGSGIDQGWAVSRCALLLIHLQLVNNPLQIWKVLLPLVVETNIVPMGQKHVLHPSKLLCRWSPPEIGSEHSHMYALHFRQPCSRSGKHPVGKKSSQMCWPSDTSCETQIPPPIQDAQYCLGGCITSTPKTKS